MERRGGPKRNARGCPRWVHFGSASIGHAPTHPDNWGARFGIDGSTADGAPVYFAPYTMSCTSISTRTATGGTTRSMVEHEPHESLADCRKEPTWRHRQLVLGPGLPRGRGFDFCANGRYVVARRWRLARRLARGRAGDMRSWRSAELWVELKFHQGSADRKLHRHLAWRWRPGVRMQLELAGKTCMELAGGWLAMVDLAAGNRQDHQ